MHSTDGVCLLCNATYGTKVNLDLHMKIRHLGMFVCSKCTKFSTLIKKRMEGHYLRVHNMAMPRDADKTALTSSGPASNVYLNPAKMSVADVKNKGNIGCDFCFFFTDTHEKLVQHAKEKHFSNVKLVKVPVTQNSGGLNISNPIKPIPLSVYMAQNQAVLRPVTTNVPKHILKRPLQGGNVSANNISVGGNTKTFVRNQHNAGKAAAQKTPEHQKKVILIELGDNASNDQAKEKRDGIVPAPADQLVASTGNAQPETEDSGSPPKRRKSEEEVALTEKFRIGESKSGVNLVEDQSNLDVTAIAADPVRPAAQGTTTEPTGLEGGVPDSQEAEQLSPKKADLNENGPLRVQEEQATKDETMGSGIEPQADVEQSEPKSAESQVAEDHHGQAEVEKKPEAEGETREITNGIHVDAVIDSDSNNGLSNNNSNSAENNSNDADNNSNIISNSDNAVIDNTVSSNSIGDDNSINAVNVNDAVVSSSNDAVVSSSSDNIIDKKDVTDNADLDVKTGSERDAIDEVEADANNGNGDDDDVDDDDGEMYRCMKCGWLTFDNKTDLHDHLRTKHGEKN